TRPAALLERIPELLALFGINRLAEHLVMHDLAMHPVSEPLDDLLERGNPLLEIVELDHVRIAHQNPRIMNPHAVFLFVAARPAPALRRRLVLAFNNIERKTVQRRYSSGCLPLPAAMSSTSSQTASASERHSSSGASPIRS